MTDRVESAPPQLWDRDRNALLSIDKPFEDRHGLFWVTDPGTGESLGQIELGVTSAVTGPRSVVDVVFFALVADMAGAPQELVDAGTGEVAGRVCQSLYGRCTWRGAVSSPLLFAGQYEDGESGWVYNRFRYYDPAAGVYGSQDPLGVGQKVATAQGYVDHTVLFSDPYGLANTIAHKVGSTSGGPGRWENVDEGMSARAREYQERITGVTSKQTYKVNGVKFDGYDNGLQDARGPDMPVLSTRMVSFIRGSRARAV